MEGLEFDSIRDIERVWLERKFEKEREIEEIFHIVRDLEGDKASGPNGFVMTFIIIVGE